MERSQCKGAGEVAMTLDAVSVGDPHCSTPTPEPPPSQTRHGCNLRIAVSANQGGRKYMEDRIHVESVRRSDGSIDYTFLAIYDGHGGFEASDFCRRHLLTNIVSQAEFRSDIDEDVLTAIRRGFLQTHQQMWKIVDTWPRTLSGYSSTAGTTASVALIMNGKVYTGHVGDSMIMLNFKQPEKFTRLTVDHKPDSWQEKHRIESSGGSVQVKSMVHRVVWTRPARGHVGPIRRSTPTENIPFLAVARSLGDFWSFCESTGEFVVSPHPDLDVIELTDAHSSLVLASDGLTNVLSAYNIVALMNGVEEYDEQGMPQQSRTVFENPARRLLSRSLEVWKRYRADNISVITVLFDPPSMEFPTESVEEALGTVSLDQTFIEYPDAVLAVNDTGCLKLKTRPVSLLYGGIFDNDFSNVGYIGPGFITHEDERKRQRAHMSAELLVWRATHKDSPENLPPSEDDEDVETEDVEEVEEETTTVTAVESGRVTPPNTAAYVVLRTSRSATRRSRIEEKRSQEGIKVILEQTRRPPAKRVSNGATTTVCCKIESSSSCSEEARAVLVSALPFIDGQATPEGTKTDQLPAGCEAGPSTSATGTTPASATAKRGVKVMRRYHSRSMTAASTSTTTSSPVLTASSPTGAQASPVSPVAPPTDVQVTPTVALTISTDLPSSSTPTDPAQITPPDARPPPMTSSRKRSRVPVTGATPLVAGLTIVSPTTSKMSKVSPPSTSGVPRTWSEPSTPIRSPIRAGSRWSLNRLEEMADAGLEPAPKRSRIWGLGGFIKKLLGRTAGDEE